MRPLVAFVTCREQQSLTRDDRLAADQLAERAEVSAVPWDRPRVRWRDFDAVVLRSTWNYHRDASAFGAWLDRLDELRVPTWNPPKTVRWNLDKSRYLPDLQARGIDIVPTVFLDPIEDRRDLPNLRTVLTARGWERAVIKPAISASSFQTWVCTTDDVDGSQSQDRLADLLNHSTGMVQPFLPEIPELGEWSLVYFAGEFSHAVVKTAKTGEFRIQEEFGGTSTPTQPPESLQATARRIVHAVEPIPLYARVDGVEVDGRFLLAELELIEPDLFLRYDDGAAERFAEKVLDCL